MWGRSLPGARLLMNIQRTGGGVLTLYRLPGRKAAPPPRGREQDMSPGGWGEGKPQATAPRLTAGTGLSRHRCGAAAVRAP